MDLNISEKISSFIQAIFLMILPLVILLIGLALSIENVWFYLLCITWFGCGIIAYASLN